MTSLKPKEWHEQFLANADKDKIIQALKDGKEQEITDLAKSLARQSALFADFATQWKMRVTELDVRLSNAFVTIQVTYRTGLRGAEGSLAHEATFASAPRKPVRDLYSYMLSSLICRTIPA